MNEILNEGHYPTTYVKYEQNDGMNITKCRFLNKIVANTECLWCQHFKSIDRENQVVFCGIDYWNYERKEMK